MERVLEYQKCRTEHGTERSTSIKNPVMLEVISSIIDPTLLNNGLSTSSMVELVNSSSKDGLLISDAESG
tara:strand:+ start:129 stop:338 length:210 start_codon:yes stop_codon:yes gene_type:complete